MDPAVQDIKAHGIEETKFNRAVEAMIPVVKEDYTFFESFLMDEFPDIYNEASDNRLKIMHGWFQIGAKLSSHTDMGTDMFNKWNEYVLEEAKRRVEG